MISIQKNFLFIHIPKTGGNSLQKLLIRYSEDLIKINAENQDGINRFNVINDHYGTRKHSSYWDYQRTIPEVIFKKLKKFTIIRNPWDRVISYYFSPHRNILGWNRKTFIDTLSEIQPASFFLSNISPLLQRINDFVVPSNSQYFNNLDFILKFENIEDDFRKLCDLLEISYSPLPIVNKSFRKHYSNYYDDELREIVARKFRAEIAWGNYAFERE